MSVRINIHEIYGEYERLAVDYETLKLQNEKYKKALKTISLNIEALSFDQRHPIQEIIRETLE